MKLTALEKIIDNHIQAHMKGVSRSWTDNIVGYSGIGKTYLIKHLATQNDCVLINVPVSELEPADLIGSPFPKEIRPGMYMQVYALPNWLPHIRVDKNNKEVYKTFEDGITRPLIDIDLLGAKVENRKDLEEKLGEDWQDKVKGAVIFLDEINRAVDDQMKNAIFEFVEKGRIHTYASPWNTYRISAMNPPNNNYYVNEMTSEKAFMDRFMHYIMETSVEEWLIWAEENHVHELIREFIAADPKALMEEEETITLDVRRTPRSYERLSIIMNETDFPTDELIRKEIYWGAVGKTYGDNLSRHEKERFQSVPNPEDVLTNYEAHRSFLLDMKKDRSDFINMVNQYILAFLSKEQNAKKIFFINEEGGLAVYNDTVVTNFEQFIMDMNPHSRSIFVRKVTGYPHMNNILGPNSNIFNMLFADAEDAFQTE